MQETLRVGKILWSTQGTEREGVELLCAAAEAGEAEALYVLGLACFRGQGVDRDLAAARELHLAAASHGVLDALTNGGRGVAFFAPFSARRWHFDIRPIEVSPIGVREFFFTGRGLEVIANELLWLWVPSLVLLAIVFGLRRLSGPRTPAARVPDR